FNTFLPLVARYLLHTNSLQYGFLFTSLGLGSLIAALGVAFSRGHSHQGAFVGGCAFLFLLALLGLSRFYILSLLLLFLIGGASIIYSTLTQTRLQIIVSNELRGRVMGIYTLLQQGTTPIGAMFIGSVSERWGVAAAIESAAAVGGLGVVAAW